MITTKHPIKYLISDCSHKNIMVQYKQIKGDYRLHWHDCCEIEMVLSGSGSQLLNDREYPMRPGTLYMLTRADCHSVHVDDPMTVIGIMFDERLISQSVYERILTRETLGCNLTAELSGQSFRAAQGLAEALMCEDSRFENDPSELEFGNLYVGHLIDCLMIELLRSCREPQSPPTERADILGAAILYLHSHYTEPITLDELAELTHLSRSYFSELFRGATGSTFKGYLIGLRLGNACRLLANTGMSVTDICYASGFESFSNFMRSFKARYGMTPLAFRTANSSIYSEKMQ